MKQTFAQSWCLSRLLPILIGDLVPQNDRHWSVLLKYLKCLEFICSPVLKPGEIRFCNWLINNLLQSKREIFEVNEKPKDHFMRHYADQMLKFGPLRHLWTIRLEAKHDYFMEVAKLNRCHKNICKTLATRHQFAQALHSGPNLFDDTVEFVGAKQLPVRRVAQRYRVLIQQISDVEIVQYGKKVKVNNQVYGKGTVLATAGNNLPVFDEVTSAFMINDRVYIGCQKLMTLDFDPHYNAYLITRQPEVSLKMIDDIRDRTPLGLYSLPGREHMCVVLKHHCF